MFDKKRELKSLTGEISTKGVSYASIEKLKKRFGVNSKVNIPQIRSKAIQFFKFKLENSRIDKKLISYNKDSIKYLVDSKTYRGVRHKFCLPVRGQRTHTNAKTIRKQNSVRTKTRK